MPKPQKPLPAPKQTRTSPTSSRPVITDYASLLGDLTAILS